MYRASLQSRDSSLHSMSVEDIELVCCTYRLPRGACHQLERQQQRIPNASVVYEWSSFKEIHMGGVGKLQANGSEVMQGFTSISGKTLPSNIHCSFLSAWLWLMEQYCRVTWHRISDPSPLPPASKSWLSVMGTDGKWQPYWAASWTVTHLFSRPRLTALAFLPSSKIEHKSLYHFFSTWQFTRILEFYMKSQGLVIGNETTSILLVEDLPLERR